MDTATKLNLIKRNTAEIVTEDEILKLIKSKKSPVVYCGYEPSGPIHLGHMVTITKLMDLQKAGFKVKVLLADLHAYLNKKGDWKQIEKEVQHWATGIRALGLKSEVVKGTSFEFKKEYWTDVIQMALKTTINRGLRSMQEIARDIENATISQMLYPLMQAEDIKFLGVDVAQGGMEQRKIHMLARELLPELGFKAPIALHTPLITSLKGPGSKMSKSVPGSGISVIDSDDEIRNSIKGAYCPEKVAQDNLNPRRVQGMENASGVFHNPILQIAQLIIFPRIKEFKVERPAKFGGNVTFADYKGLEQEYSAGKLHPMDLKTAVTKYLIGIIGPIRKKF